MLGVALFVALFVVFRLADETLKRSGPTVPGGDLNGYFLPSMAFLHHAIETAQLPLWNPYQLAGSPFLAMQSPGATNPSILAVAWLPPHVALTVHAIGHFLLAGYLVLRVARTLGCTPIACAVAAIGYIGSAPLIAATYDAAFLSVFAWAPGVLLAVEGLSQRPGWRSSGFLTVALSLCFLGGYAQGFLYSVELAACYGVLRLASGGSWRKALQAIGWAAAAGVVAVCLVSVQLLPTLSHAAGASRDLEGLTANHADVSSLRPRHLLPSLVGMADGPAALPYLLVPLALAAVALPGGRLPGLCFVALLLLCFDFMMGMRGVSFGAQFALPGGNLFRFPTRMDFAYHLAGAVLLGLGASAIESFVRSRATGPIVRRLAVAISLLIAVGVAVDLWLRNPLPRRYEPLASPELIYGPPELVEFARKIGYQRIYVRTLVGASPPVKLGTLQQIFTAPDYDPMLPGDYAAYFDAPRDVPWHGRIPIDGIAPAGIKKPKKPGRFVWRRKVHADQDPRLLDLISIAYYDLNTLLPSAAAPMARALELSPVKLYGRPAIFERPHALPRAYVVHEVIETGSDAEALERVRALDFDPRRQVVTSVAVAGLPGGPPGPDEGASIESYRLNRAVVRAHCDSPCVLVLSDLYTKDWKVRVDGAPAELLRANFLVRGVRLEPGTSEVEFRYRPRAFYAGAGISLATLAAIGTGLLVSRVRLRAAR